MFTRKGTISRPVVGQAPTSIYSNVVEDITIKCQFPNIPRPVHINDIALPRFPEESKFLYDFALEEEGLEMVKTRCLGIAGEYRSLTRVSATTPQDDQKPKPVFPPLPRGEILTPEPVGETVLQRKDDAAQGINLIDFENTDDPFDTVTLKAIDERAELATIFSTTEPVVNLQSPPTVTMVTPILSTSPKSSDLPLVPPRKVSGDSSTIKSRISPLSISPVPLTASQPVVARSAPPFSNPVASQAVKPPSTVSTAQALLDHPSSTPVATSIIQPPVPKPRKHPPPVTLASLTPYPMLTDTSSSERHNAAVPGAVVSETQTPSTVSDTFHARPQFTTKTSPTVPPRNTPKPAVNQVHQTQLEQPPRAPLSQSTPQPKKVPPPIPPPYSSTREGTRPSAVGGIRVLPPMNGPLLNNTRPAPPQYTPTDPAMPSRPTPPLVAPKPKAQSNSDYMLEDPSESLSDEELERVLSISSMGFSHSRVARAMKRLHKDEGKVLDFLFLVGKLEELGYPGNTAETALINSGGEVDKAVDYIKQLNLYKEMGYKEKSIHEAYKKGNESWDKAIDVLMQTS